MRFDEGDGFLYGSDPCVRLKGWNRAINLNTKQIMTVSDDQVFQEIDIELTLKDKAIDLTLTDDDLAFAFGQQDEGLSQFLANKMKGYRNNTIIESKQR